MKKRRNSSFWYLNITNVVHRQLTSAAILIFLTECVTLSELHMSGSDYLHALNGIRTACEELGEARRGLIVTGKSQSREVRQSYFSFDLVG